MCTTAAGRPRAQHAVPRTCPRLLVQWRDWEDVARPQLPCTPAFPNSQCIWGARLTSDSEAQPQGCLGNAVREAQRKSRGSICPTHSQTSTSHLKSQLLHLSRQLCSWSQISTQGAEDTITFPVTWGNTDRNLSTSDLFSQWGSKEGEPCRKCSSFVNVDVLEFCVRCLLHQETVTVDRSPAKRYTKKTHPRGFQEVTVMLVFTVERAHPVFCLHKLGVHSS